MPTVMHASYHCSLDFLPCTCGVPDKNNFHQYRMIRIGEAPKNIDVHFVPSEVDPTGLGEPPFPLIFGAMANALYQATGKRSYRQPFLGAGTLPG